MTYLGDPREAGTRFGSSRWTMVIYNQSNIIMIHIGGNNYEHTDNSYN